MKICDGCNTLIDSGCGKYPYCGGKSFIAVSRYGSADRMKRNL